MSWRAKHVKTRSRGESQQILWTFLDGFLLSVTHTLMQIYIIPKSASLNNSEELHIRNFQLQTKAAIFEVFILNLQISKWRISKIGLLQECRVLQIQKIPKKLNDRKLKQSLNMAQEISWSVWSRTAGIFASFVWSTNESILEQL